MKKLISLLSILSLFALAIACNNSDRQDEEVRRGVETTEERVDDQNNKVIEERMEETYRDSEGRLHDDIEINKTKVEEETDK